MISENNIVVAILAKDKAFCLPLYLKCIYNQTYPKQNIHLYVRTNDNKDNTEEILQTFINDHGSEYASVFFDSANITESLKKYDHHEWNCERFKILGQIRQDSITHAIDKCAHYFVADCDNFITPDTIQTLFDNKNMGVIAPMLVSQIAYSNFHYECTDTGYYADHENYMPVLNRKITGLISVKVVHCTYFINNNILQHVLYNDNSYRYEYVIFNDVLRKNNITQYLDNRNNYGFLVFEDNKNDFDNSIITNWEKQQKEIFNT